MQFGWTVLYVICSRLKWRCLLVVSVCTPTGCISLEAKDDSYRDLSLLARDVHSADGVVVASDRIAQLGYFVATEGRIGFPFSVPASRIVNGDRLIQVHSDHTLLLANANFCHRKLTWRPPSPSKHWIQVDHTAIVSWWRGSVDFGLFWSTPKDLKYALVCVYFYLRLV